VGASRRMDAQPLTHHDILGLIEPFTRSGRQVDLAASDRIQRRLLFKTRTPNSPAAAAQLVTDTLELESMEGGACVLKRLLTHTCGLAATLVARSSDTAALLAALEAVDPLTLFRQGDGWVLACSYRVEVPAGQIQPMTKPAALLLASAVVQVQGLNVVLKMPGVVGYPGELEVTAAAAIELPDDLLQVLGRDWARLSRSAKGWRGNLQIRGKEPERSRLAEKHLEAAARHLAQTLSQPPAAFHQQQASARWRVAARRSVPLLTLLALVLGALAVPYLGLEQNSVYWMLIFNAPPLLLLWGFSMREMPSFDLPRPPKRLTATHWWSTPIAEPLASSPESTPPGTSAANGTP